MRKILFIINSKAGKTEFDIKKEDIEETFRKAGRLSEIEVVNTRYKNHTKYLIDAFDTLKYDEKIVIICGGDGSLNELVNVAYGKDMTLGLIPTGTGNDFAKNFDYESFTLNSLLNFKTKKIDLIKVNDFYSINVTSLGFDTQVLKRAYDYLDKNPKLGKKAYGLAVLKSLNKINCENLELKLELVDGSNFEIKGDYLISAICNGGFYGSGFNPAPESKIDDGVLNLLLADKIPFIRFVPLIKKYKEGRHKESKYINEILVKSGTIKSKNKFIANADGEIFETDEIKFQVLPQALNWVIFE
ncbi:diacylglycerol kinase family lipid kinase [Anaerococcus murdochii]|uniref:Diacylglycerol kinase family lipid kinase n=1 Tax=Anaerococcus murdochii TaxID=411577 RepID=A0ABS7SW53_9FIRM|nr:diacylglycerol kinase family protein [Anaerococcus murdochii]MBZ2385741.1 diacylglycerol kinase family lipid kinase [Anaerococcus murdochii]